MASPSRSEPLRPLFLASYGAFGGSEAVLMRIIKELGGEIDGQAVVMAEGAFSGRLEVTGMPVHVEPMPGRRAMLRTPLVASRLARRYRHQPLHFIHANGTKAAVLGVPLARRLGIPLLWMKHDHGYEGLLTRTVARGCDCVLCVSQAMAELLGPAVQDRVVVAYPGVDVSHDPPRTGTAKRIAATGRLDPAKGFDQLIRAVAILVGRGHSDLQLRIAGPAYPVFPDHPDELRALAAELGIADRTEIGWVDDIDDHYRAARVAAMTSLKIRGRPAEGAPLVLMEAMSHGRPGVGPAEEGIREVLGEGGTVVEDRTPEGYADALEPYLEDSEMADAVGALGRRRVEERFTTEAMMAVVREAYERLDMLGRERRG